MRRAWPFLFALAGPALAAEGRVDWHTVDAGGGASSGGRYSIVGTIGQPDADEISLCSPDGGVSCVAARYEVTGGYWTGSAGAPAGETIFHDGFES